MAVVIGSGLLAKFFLKSTLGNEYLIFASGVSNSLETRKSEFERERQLLRQVIRDYPNLIMVYFSTCSIYQEKLTPYVNHKMEMEVLITNSVNNYHIYRLPQVVGPVDNSTLVSYFVKSIYSGSSVKLMKEAKRNLVSVADITRIVELIASKHANENVTTNIAAAYPVRVTDVYHYIASICDKESNFELISGGESYDIPLESIRGFIDNSDYIFTTEYWQHVLDKYVPEIKNTIECNL